MTHAIVTAARSWLGTRFHHQGRIKQTATHKGGVDCLGLLTGIAHELDLRSGDGTPLAAFDETDYPHQPDVIRLKTRLNALLNAIAITDIQPADILLLNVDGSAQHLAIVTDLGDELGIIHAYAPARQVVEHHLDSYWNAAISAAFRI
jgi:cell wall-associated NlpC family hydrolase